MLKYIDNKLYNTQTARALARAERGEGNDHAVETLYRKKSGEYFLHGEGGARTNYARKSKSGAGWEAGEEITPISYAAARDWAQANLVPEKYDELFGAAQSDERKTLFLCIDAKTHAAIRQMSAAREITQAALIERLVAAEYTSNWRAKK